MIRGSIVVYGTEGPLAHILAGCPGRYHAPGVVAFAGVLRTVDRADYAPARLWLRRGREPWHGPLSHWRAVREALAARYGDRGAIATGLDPGRRCPNGAETISGGWRYRIAWGGEVPPVRDG